MSRKVPYKESDSNTEKDNGLSFNNVFETSTALHNSFLFDDFIVKLINYLTNNYMARPHIDLQKYVKTFIKQNISMIYIILKENFRV